MCDKADETISQIVSECTKLAQKESKRRHDWINRRSHCEKEFQGQKNGVSISHQCSLRMRFEDLWNFNPLSANPTKWSNTLKQFVGNSQRIV